MLFRSGWFRAPLLPPGTYTVRVTLSGFHPLVLEGLRLYVGQESHLPLTLEFATVATFRAETENNAVEGEVAFLSHGGVTYRMLGYTAAARWSARRAVVASTVSSFAPVTDPAVLDVQPMRLRIVTLPEAMSLNSFVRANPQGVDVDELARLNRVGPGEVIPARTRIKVVEGVRR